MEPTSPLVLGLVLVAIAALFWSVVRLGHVAAKAAAAVLAFALSVGCGVLLVNDYYGYYTTWGSAAADLSGGGNSFAARQLNDSHVASSGKGRLLIITLRGSRSRISRKGLVYLPPQYFESRYRTFRFPVIELLHGTPGNPAQWANQGQAGVITQRLIDSRRMGPVVLVMPDSNGSLTGAQECLNTPRFQDDTYIAQDVPADIRSRFRVSRDPGQWGLLGGSSGGYCAANLALRHPDEFGAVASIDGYYRPQDGPAGTILGHDATLTRENDPLSIAAGLRPGQAEIPPFWIAAGTGVRDDYTAATQMVTALGRTEGVPLLVMKGAHHTFAAIRRALPGALTWSWQQLCTPDQRRQFPTYNTARGASDGQQAGREPAQR